MSTQTRTFPILRRVVQCIFDGWFHWLVVVQRFTLLPEFTCDRSILSLVSLMLLRSVVAAQKRKQEKGENWQLSVHVFHLSRASFQIDRQAVGRVVYVFVGESAILGLRLQR